MTLKEIFQELWTPSGSIGVNPKGYQRAVEGIGHSVLGAFCVSLLGLPMGVLTSFVIAAIYFVVKETSDLKKGGRLPDSVEDALFVAIGCAYSGPVVWPLTVLLVAGYSMVRTK